MVDRPRVDLAELRFVTLFGLGLLLVTALPYAYGYLASPPERQFMGLIYGVHDHGQYMSWARESANGFFISNKLTPEDNAPVFFNWLWWVLGRSAKYLGLTFAEAYQGFRFLSGALFVAAAYYFFAIVFPEPARRRFALVLACTTSGFGWLWVVVKQFTGQMPFPNDLYTSPGNSFFTIMAVPHLIFSAALLLLVFSLVLQGQQRGHLRYFMLAGVISLALGMEHIYDLVTVYAVLAVFGVMLTIRNGFSRRLILGLAAVVLLAAPAPIYWGYLAQANPVWRDVLAQYPNLGAFTPDPLHLLILLGLAFPVAALSFRSLVSLKGGSEVELFVRGWFLVNLLIIYLPINFQVMLLNGFQVAIAALAVWGLFDHIVPWLKQRLADSAEYASRSIGWLRVSHLANLAPLLFLALVLPTNAYLFVWRFVELGRIQYPYYLYRDEVAALNWLAKHADPSEVVLSSLVIGHYVPGLAGTRAFLAHGAQTLDFFRKRELVARFFDSTTKDQDRIELIKRFDVRYVFYGDQEQVLGNYRLDESAYLDKVFSLPHSSIYRVRNANLGPEVSQ